MSQVLIRDVGEDVLGTIKDRARKRGVSMQKELQAILQMAAAWDLTGEDRTVYPPVRPVAAKGKPASRSLIEERR